MSAQYRLHLGTSSQRVTRWRNIEASAPVLASRGRVRLEFRSVQPELESVMRGSSFAGGGRAVDFETLQKHEATLVPSIAPAPEFDPLALPLMQQAALIQMHESHVKRAIVAKLLEDSQDKPSLPDYRALVEAGLATKRLTEKWHNLTAEGSIAARKLEQRLCAQLNIHLLIRGGDVGWQTIFKCPCGWSTRVRRSNTAPGNANVAFNRHLTTTQAMRGLRDALTCAAEDA